MATSTGKNEVVIVLGEKAVRVPAKVWQLFHACAGQMIADGDHFDYYKGRETKANLAAVSSLYDATSL